MPNPRNQPGRGRGAALKLEQSGKAATATRAKRTKPAPSESSQWTAYCIKCKGKQQLTNPSKDKFKNGTKIITGQCVQCDGRLNVIVKQEVWDNFEN